MRCPKCDGTRKIGIGPLLDCPDCVFPEDLKQGLIITLTWMIRDIDWRNHCQQVPIREQAMENGHFDPGEKEDSPEVKKAREQLVQLEGME